MSQPWWRRPRCELRNAGRSHSAVGGRGCGVPGRFDRTRGRFGVAQEDFLYSGAGRAR